MKLARGNDRWVRATWLRADAEPVRFLGAVKWAPSTIIDFRGENARARGVLNMWPAARCGLPQDDLLRSVWPRPGTDRIEIKQRTYEVLAIQRYSADPPHDHVYEVFIR